MVREPTKILIAVEGSAASDDAVAYAGAVLAGRPGTTVYVVHVVGPLPGELRAAGGQAPTDERRDAQAAWMTAAREEAKILLAAAAERLRAAGVDDDAIVVRVAEMAEGTDVAATILEAARELDCDTVILGREAISWVPSLHYPHVGEHLVRAGKGLTTWIVG